MIIWLLAAEILLCNGAFHYMRIFTDTEGQTGRLLKHGRGKLGCCLRIIGLFCNSVVKDVVGIVQVGVLSDGGNRELTSIKWV